jgi:hypothetical protein
MMAILVNRSVVRVTHGIGMPSTHGRGRLDNESVPTPSSPERPPLAPYDPPDPAPQAAAWRRALKVVEERQAIG